jgi:hypothetical protein
MNRNNRKIYLTAAVCLLCLSQAQAQIFNINAGNGTVSTDGESFIYGDGTPTRNTITVNSGVVASVILENVNIDVSSVTNACAFDMTNATVTLCLAGDNTLKSGDASPGILAPSGSTLKITSFAGNDSTGGTVNATGGEGGAGIGGAGSGGRNVQNSGMITISGGTVNTTGGSGGAGIGGGVDGDSRGITISGGTVNATGGDHAASIGGGWNGSGHNIVISGGIVTATGGDHAAGIGGGWNGSGHNIVISGGTVTATGGESGAGIGGDRDGSGEIIIAGGAVVAIAGSGAAIGGSDDVLISGGTIIATGNGIGIGAGGGNTPTTISGNPIIFAIAINGMPSTPERGIATGSDVNIDPSTKMITLNADFTVPAGATLTVPDGWTLDYTGFSLINNGVVNGNIIPELFNINAGSVTISTDGEYTITSTGEPTTNTITIDSGVVAAIRLENVNIDVSNTANACAFNMLDATVTLRLAGTNTLKSGESRTGLQVSEGATLTITSTGGDGSTLGTLNATGGNRGAGIGGGYNGSGGDITISGGTINATGGLNGAGIGGSYEGNGGDITISGGTINATGGNNGGGIGCGGLGNSGGNITISGGTVIAIGTYYGAAIGGGYNCNGGAITISGGTAIAIGTYGATGIGIGNGSISITGNPAIFATAINGISSAPERGIASGGDVNIDRSSKTITLNRDFTVPQNALLALPPDWTLNTNGRKLVTNGAAVRSAAAQQVAPGISTVDESSSVTVGFYNKILYIDSPAAERIEVYSMSGNPLFKASKPAGEAFFPVTHPERLLIVRGSSSWVKKIEDR